MMINVQQAVDELTRVFIVLGITLNVLLLYLIRRFSKKEIGSYANLLTMFAAYDVVLIVINYLLLPRAIAIPYCLAVVLEVEYVSKILTCFHSISFIISYFILITHFVYRYWIVAKPFRIVWFSSPKFYVLWLLFVVSFCTFLIIITNHITSSEDSVAGKAAFLVYQDHFGGDISNGWVVFDYLVDGNYNYTVVFLTLFYNTIGSSVLSVVGLLASLTYRRIASSFNFSAQSKRVQMRLLVAAIVQTAIPVVCVSVPFACNMNMPLLGYPLPMIAESSGLALALFPAWDPLALILLLKPYRKGVVAMFTRTTQKEMSSKSPPSKVKRSDSDPNDDQQAFAPPLTVGEKDYFSKLPFDCMNEIFSLFDHCDLDVLSGVSQTMNEYAAHARPAARNGVVEGLGIRNSGVAAYTLTLCFWSHRVSTIIITSRESQHGICQFCNILVRQIKMQDVQSKLEIYKLFKTISAIPNRYDFSTVTFESIHIDYVFFTFCKEFFNVPCKRRIFTSVEMDPELNGSNLGFRMTEELQNLGYNLTDKHIDFDFYQIHNWMLVGCEELEISTKDFDPFKAALLLRSCASNPWNVTPSLRMESTRTPKQAKFRNYHKKLSLSVQVEHDFLTAHRPLTTFITFDSLDLDFLVFDPVMLTAILRRNGRQRAGVWRVLTAGVPDISVASIVPGMIIYSKPDGSLAIGSNGIEEMTIKSAPTDYMPTVYSVEVTFHA